MTKLTPKGFSETIQENCVSKVLTTYGMITAFCTHYNQILFLYTAEHS